MNPSQDEPTFETVVLSSPAIKHDVDETHHRHAHGQVDASVQKTPTKQAPSVQKYLPTELEPLAWLAGQWQTWETGKCIYPTMQGDFMYAEAIEFIFNGQPMLDYKAESWNPEKGREAVLHREVGFLRIKPGTDKVALVLAHNFGVSEMLEGTFTKNLMTLSSSGINRMSFAANPAVTYTHRVFKYDPQTEELEHVMCMATTNTDLTEHLRIKYKRATHAVDGHSRSTFH